MGQYYCPSGFAGTAAGAGAGFSSHRTTCHPYSPAFFSVCAAGAHTKTEPASYLNAPFTAALHIKTGLHAAAVAGAGCCCCCFAHPTRHKNDNRIFRMPKRYPKNITRSICALLLLSCPCTTTVSPLRLRVRCQCGRFWMPKILQHLDA